jgi:quinol-cytochrome oxidoreductase complex cytochrome b subunit
LSRLTALLSSVDARLGFGPAWRAFVGHPAPGAPSWGRALAGAALGLFALECLTGLALAFHYSPSMTSAWASVAWLETHVPGGSLIRAVHQHGTSALFVVYALLLAHGLATATWRRPREALWLNALVTFLLLPAFALTGNFLPLDQGGWHGLEVELGVIASAPFGDTLKAALIGGPELGQTSVTRLYALHALGLPAVALFHIALWAFIARDRAAPSLPPHSPSRPPAPLGQTLRTLSLLSLAFATVLALSLALGPARLDAPADPGAAFPARPEWYFMALNQLNALLGTIGGLVVPPLIVLAFAAAPLIDRGRRPRLAALPASIGALALAALTALGLWSDASDADLLKADTTAREDAASALSAFSSEGLDGLGRAPSRVGLSLYREKGCASCHDDTEVAAPRLAGWNTLARTAAFLKDPDGERFFKGSPLEGSMTAFGGNDQARDALSRYLLHGSGHPDEASTTPAQLAAGKQAFSDDGCDTCHNPPEKAPRDAGYDPKPTGPDLRGYASFEWTRALIRDVHDPRFFGGAVDEATRPKMMPAYAELSDDELGVLSRWLVMGAPGAL